MRGVGLLVLMLSCGVVSLAEETTPPPTDSICFSTGLINGGQEIEITGYNTSTSACGKNVVIPAKISGKPVTSIGMDVFRGKQLTSVMIPGSVTSIGTGAFYLNKLTGVVIPGSVKSIGKEAFAQNELTGVVIPGSVKSIGEGVFGENKLTSVVISDGVTSIGDYVFYNNPLTSVVIPDSVTSIGQIAFYKDSVTDGYTGMVVGIVTKDPTTITVGENAYIKLVKFDLAGGTGAVNVTCEGTGCSVTSIPTRAGYIFSGWNEGLKVWDEGSSNWNTGSQTIIAQWKVNSSSSSSSSSSSWGGYSWGGISHSSTSSSSSSTSTPSTEQKKPETPVKNEPVKTEQVKTEIFNPTIKTTCFNPLDKQTIDQGNKISELLRIAHQMLYSYSLTKWQGTKDFAPERSLTREEAARFMTEFATNVLCRKASRTYNDHFTDLEKVNPELLPYIKKSYEYLIFNGDSNAEGKKEKTTFRPKELITVGELSAIMTRLVRNELLPEVEWDRSKNYRTYINAITPKSDLKNEIRGTVAEVIYDLYRNNDYELKDIGYVIKK